MVEDGGEFRRGHKPVAFWHLLFLPVPVMLGQAGRAEKVSAY